jgi:hypothetical protein
MTNKIFALIVASLIIFSDSTLAENITPEGVQRSEVHILSLLLSIICS